MPDFSDHFGVMQRMLKMQEVEEDVREVAKDAAVFITKPNGQWESDFWSAMDGRPRYQFDMVNPMVKQGMRDFRRIEFSIDVDPIFGGKRKELAKTINGVIRTIQAQCDAEAVYNAAKKPALVKGIAGWYLKHDYGSNDSFDMDIMVKPLVNYDERAWLGFHQERDGSDAIEGWLLTAMDSEEFSSKYPDANGGVPQGLRNLEYWSTPDTKMVGDYYYLKEETIELALLSTGDVMNVEDLRGKEQGLLMQGITVKRTRKRKQMVCYVRRFCADQWLGEAKRTVFSWIPIIPVYNNWMLIENKVTYHGMVAPVMDSQRVYNYTSSREVEEVAMAPRRKYWMTETQVGDYADTLETLNTNADPVQLYNPDSRVPGPPQQSGGADVNPALLSVSEKMRSQMALTMGMFAASMGDVPEFAQSGIAIDKLQERGEAGIDDAVEAMQVAIAHTGRMMVDALPRVYDTERVMYLMGEDKSREEVTLNQRVIGPDNQVMIENDLSSTSEYMVSCRSGPSFKNKQQATVSTIMELAKPIPELLQMNADILLSNIDSPGADLMAERYRERNFKAGLIPISQMTEDEKKKAVQKAQEEAQSGQQDPATMLAQAEMQKAQADILTAEVNKMKAQLEAQRAQQDDNSDLQVEARRLQLEERRVAIDEMKAETDAAYKAAQTSKLQAEAATIAPSLELEAFKARQTAAQQVKPDFVFDEQSGTLRAAA